MNVNLNGNTRKFDDFDRLIEIERHFKSFSRGQQLNVIRMLELRVKSE